MGRWDAAPGARGAGEGGALAFWMICERSELSGARRKTVQRCVNVSVAFFPK